MPRPGERLLPATTALLLVLSFPPLHLLVPPFVALVPFAVFLGGLEPGSAGERAALRTGFSMGVLYFGVLLYWMVAALIWYTWLAIPAYLGSVLLLALLMALFAWALHRSVHAVGLPLWLALPVTWTAAEWFRAHWHDLAFPWLGLGHSLTGYPQLVGMAEVVGARGVTFWIALVNGIGAELVRAVRAGGAGAPRRRRASAALAAVLALPALWGVWRARTLETVPVARVAVLQPNIPEHLKLDRKAALDSTLRTLDALMPRVEPGSVDLVIWPEAALTEFLAHPRAEAVVERVRKHAARVRAPILTGALGYEFDGSGRATPYNSAFAVTPEGLAPFRYDKHFLVPFVERVPFINPRRLPRLQYFGTFGNGRGWPLAGTPGARYGVLICYESSFPQASRAYRREGADFLVNITNDAWYGREPWYARTTALWQHPAHLVMRAIENRTGVARAANTGISLFVDPVGRTYGATRLFQATLRGGTVYTTRGTTLYTRLGDVAGSASAALAALVLGWAWWRRKGRGRGR